MGTRMVTGRMARTKDEGQGEEDRERVGGGKRQENDDGEEGWKRQAMRWDNDAEGN